MARLRSVYRLRAGSDGYDRADILEGPGARGRNDSFISVSYGITLLHLRFLCCILGLIETTMSFADPNQALSRGNAVSTELIPVLGLVLIIGVGVAGPA
jgi:hypothetical protein